MVNDDTAARTPTVEPADLRAALLVFCRKYVVALVANPLIRRAFGFGQWRPHPQIPYHFVPLDGLMPVQGVDTWPEYQTLEPLFRADPKILRHLTSARTTGAQVPDFAGLLAGVVTMPLERALALRGVDQGWVPEIVDDTIAWLHRDDDPMFVAIPLGGFTSEEPLTLAANISVRRATDDEVGMLLRLGAIDVEHAMSRNSTLSESRDVHEAARWVVVLDHARPRAFGKIARTVAEPDLKALEGAADALVAATRILTPNRILRGPTVSVMPDLSMNPSGQVSNRVPSAAWSWHNSAEITAGMKPTLESLADKILNGRARQLKIEHGIRRFSESVTKANHLDRIVDLVTALESTLSNSHEALGYQVARRVSALLVPLRLPAETVYRFIKKAYDTRSKIVHGDLPKHTNFMGAACEPEEQLLQLDRVVAEVLRQVLTASFTGEPHEYVEGILHFALDGASPAQLPVDETVKYAVRVSYQDRVFMGTSPEPVTP